MKHCLLSCLKHGHHCLSLLQLSRSCRHNGLSGRFNRRLQVSPSRAAGFFPYNLLRVMPSGQVLGGWMDSIDIHIAMSSQTWQSYDFQPTHPSLIPPKAYRGLSPGNSRMICYSPWRFSGMRHMPTCAAGTPSSSNSNRNICPNQRHITMGCLAPCSIQIGPIMVQHVRPKMLFT